MSNRSKKDRRLIKQEAAPPAPEFSILAAFRKGPFPPPAEMERYEVIYPGATRLLFDNFVSQTNHRMELEKLVIQGDNQRATTAQRNAFIITLAILLLAGVLFYTGKDGAAIAAVFTSLTPVIVSFINSSIARKKERDNKRRSLGI